MTHDTRLLRRAGAMAAGTFLTLTLAACSGSGGVLGETGAPSASTSPEPSVSPIESAGISPSASVETSASAETSALPSTPPAASVGASTGMSLPPIPSGSLGLVTLCTPNGDLSLAVLATNLRSAATNGQIDAATQQSASQIADALSSMTGLSGAAEQARSAAVDALGSVNSSSVDATTLNAAATAIDAAATAICPTA